MTDQITETKRAFEQPEWYLSSREYNIRLRAELVRAWVKQRNDLRILDIGCGNGSMSVQLLNASNRLTLLDLSSSMLNIASARVPAEFQPQVECINSGVMQADLSGRAYNLILSIGVLAYIEDLDAYVKRLTALARPGAMIIVECSDSSHFISWLVRAYERLRGLFTPTRVPLVLRPSQPVLEAFQKAGCTLLDSYRYSLPLPVVGKPFSHEFHYRMIHRLFGPPAGNRNAWLGNECIFCFQLNGGK